MTYTEGGGLESTLESRCARDKPLDCLVDGFSRKSSGVIPESFSKTFGVFTVP